MRSKHTIAHTHTVPQGTSYSVVSVEEDAATLCVWHTDSFTHDETCVAPAPLHTGRGVTVGGCCQVGTGGGARCHTRRIGAVGTADEG